jgi:branched-chain amino acid transport system ATP-binding protein
MTTGPLLQLEHVSLSFKGIKAITDIGFAVQRHEICALIGPNGAGKSSLLNVINGLYRPDAGRIVFDGQSRSHMQPRLAALSGIARTFQNIAIFKGMSVLQNVLAGASLQRRGHWLARNIPCWPAAAEDDAQRERAERAIEFLQLQRYRHHTVGQLPYGLQKRVELARALAAQPKLLLLDEPMAGMNAEEKREMSGFVSQVNQALGTTVVLIEHDMKVVMGISQHVVVLDYGRIVGDGTPDAVRSNPEVLQAYLGRKARAVATLAIGV